ncbi:MAG TPA: DUF4340 domain-containing protein [Caulobacterales bacterium]|nr:DUF4340 domain-containing protein [Caulobacterales bacterium]
MSTVLAERRKGRLISLALAAAALAATAFVTVAIDVRSSQPEAAAGAVVPDLADRIGDAQRIIVTSSDASYRIERVQRGDQSIWVMRDRGDFPVQAARLGQLTRGLEGLQFTRRMTSDPAKQARLGVDDPRHGGHGLLVQIEDGRGAFIVNLILGVETGGLYVRRPDQNQVWSAHGDLPPLRDVASWLDLKPIDLDAQQIARVEIAPAQGNPYVLARDTAQTADFAIVAPARLAATSPSAVTALAERIAHLAPVDVQTAPAIQGPPRSRIRVVTFGGVAIDGDLIESDNKTWLKLVARPQAAEPTPEQQQAALAINTRAAGWAYALSPEEADALAPALSTLLPQAPARATPSGSGATATTTSRPPPSTPAP